MIKRWYYSASHWRLGYVMMANTWLNCSFFTLMFDIDVLCSCTVMYKMRTAALHNVIDSLLWTDAQLQYSAAVPNSDLLDVNLLWRVCRMLVYIVTLWGMYWMLFDQERSGLVVTLWGMYWMLFDQERSGLVAVSVTRSSCAVITWRSIFVLIEELSTYLWWQSLALTLKMLTKVTSVTVFLKVIDIHNYDLCKSNSYINGSTKYSYC